MSAHVNPKHRALIFTLTILGCLFILFFGLRVFHATQKFRGHPPMPPLPTGGVETDIEQIRDWMTIPFVSRMYGVPEEIIFNAVGISPEGNRRKSLEQLDDEYFPDANRFVIELVKTAILAHQSPPMPAAPLTPVPPLTPDSPAPP